MFIRILCKDALASSQIDLHFLIIDIRSLTSPNTASFVRLDFFC
nr:MAG TPA: hypothetical protein [Caudoviricetes sp.]